MCEVVGGDTRIPSYQRGRKNSNTSDANINHRILRLPGTSDGAKPWPNI
jgi:hypothetical protein